jgi:HK97 family phage prohead protease
MPMSALLSAPLALLPSSALQPASNPPPALTLAPDGRVEGYASLFGAVDQARDMVMPGAFKATLQSRGLRKIPMLFQHDPAEPVGVWHELVEDIRGLRARGQLIPDVMRARELLALLKNGAIDGLSIGYRTVRGVIDPRTRIRKLYQVDLWEISIVTFPLLDGARVSAVKEAPPSRLRARAERDWAMVQGQSSTDCGAADAPALPRRGRAVTTSLRGRADRKRALQGVMHSGGPR